MPGHQQDNRSPEEMLFNENLQEFATRIGILCALEHNNRLPPEEAYRRIKKLYKVLKRTHKSLGIGEDPPLEVDDDGDDFDANDLLPPDADPQ